MAELDTTKSRIIAAGGDAGPRSLADALLDLTRDAVTLTAATGTVLRMNAVAERLFGSPGDKTVGPPSVLADADAAPTPSLEAVLADPTPWHGRLVRVRRSGGSLVTMARIEAIEVDGLPGRLWVEEPINPEAHPDRAAEARSTAQAHLALAIGAGRIAVWDYDHAADRITGSPELNRLLGFPDDATPTTADIRSRYYPGEQERLQAIGREAMARGERFVESEFRYLWPDGSVHWVLLRAEAVPDAAGRPTRALGIVMDITDRKRAEDALRASETRLRLAQSAAGIGVWDWNLGDGSLTWSKEVYRIFGLEPGRDGPSHRLWLDVIHPDDRAPSVAAARRAAYGEPFSIEYRVLGDPLRWVRSFGAAVPDPGDQPTRVVGVNVDVTQERLREQSLRTLADDLRSEVDAAQRERDRISVLSNDLFAVIGEDGRLTDVNRAWARLLGPAGRSFDGATLLDLVHPEDRATVAAALSDKPPTGALRRFECRLARPDGDDLWIAWTAMREGEVLYAVGRDVTLDKEREAALRQAQKMDALGQLTGGIAHDFNNLLQAIGGYLELIHTKPDDAARIGSWADHALKATDRATKLTSQLLTFSRSQGIDVGALAISEAIETMRDLLERTLGPTIAVRLDLAPGEVAVTADRNQFEVALLNLAINARDAMPDGGELSIATRELVLDRDVELPAGNYVEVRVSDTGRGMPAAVATRAFDPFFTTKAIGKGTGLGLSQVYGMARQAGGVARLDSRPGRGTTVSILLRRTAFPSVQDQAADDQGAAGPALGTVLVIDDDLGVRRLISDMLGAMGYAVATASDGPEGLVALDEVSPDLILLDFAMPGMDGAEVAKAVRARRPDVPIIFASGHADTAAMTAAVGPVVPRLHKPFKMGELATVLAATLPRPALP